MLWFMINRSWFMVGRFWMRSRMISCMNAKNFLE